MPTREFLGDAMAQRRPPWWWQSEILARIAMALSAAETAGYLARLLTLFVWSGLWIPVSFISRDQMA